MIEALNSALIFILSLILIALGFKLFDLLRKNEAPFVSSPEKLFNQIEKALEIKSGEVVYDLGCGNAKFLRHCAENHPDSEFIGLETGTIPYALSKINTIRYKNVQIQYKDFNDIKIKNYSKVFVYLFPKGVGKIIDKLPNKYLLASLNFRAENKKPNKIITLKNSTSISRKLYIYKK
jgi:hypothetical protein